jgi:hypothetical protein
MKFLKKINNRLQDPTFLRKFHGWATIFFIILVIPTFIFGWYSSVAYVSILSVWALVASHWAAWQASRIEEKE